MKSILRASISLDGREFVSDGKMGAGAVFSSRLHDASEILLTIHPVVTGGGVFTQGENGFLSKELHFELVSVKFNRGVFHVRYRRT